MKKFKVLISNNKCFAPAIYVEVPEGKTEVSEAREAARSRSGLSRFPSWKFIPITY